ncbi:MAG: NlpC/P60 family protein [Bacteroidota bacterium]|nr:NlpC/P60 family protein [Bacteroidota bacterium]
MNGKSRANIPLSRSTKAQRSYYHEHSAYTPKETKLLESAERWLGTPYRYGSSSRTGTDCSGFVMRVYEEQGISLPRSTKDQFLVGRAVHPQELRIGDLVFFNTTGAGVSHVGIYIGNDTLIHASSKSGVTKQSLSEPYLAQTYIGARRVFNDLQQYGP